MYFKNKDYNRTLKKKYLKKENIIITNHDFYNLINTTDTDTKKKIKKYETKNKIGKTPTSYYNKSNKKNLN